MYYGWWIVIATSCVLFVSTGIGFFTFPVFLKFMEVDLQVGRDTLSCAGALGALAAGFSTPLIGYAMDRYPARAVMLPGAVLLSAGFLFLSRARSPLELYLVFLAVGVAMAATTLLPVQTLVSRWFEARRGRAMGITAVAGTLGGMVWMPVSSRLIEALGWRDAYAVLAGVIAVVSIPLVWTFIRSSPRSMGLTLEGEGRGRPPRYGDGDRALREGGGVGPEEEAGYETAEALAKPGFWLIFCSSFFGPFASAGFGLHAVAFLSDCGFSPEGASLVWSLLMGVSLCGMFLCGLLAERYRKRYLCAAAQGCRGLSVLLLVLFSLGLLSRTSAVIQLVVLTGLAAGCINVVSPLLVSETFGVRAFGRLSGLLGIPFTLGMAAGQVVGGRLYVVRNNYDLAFTVFGLAFLVSGVALGLVRPYFLVETERQGG